VSERLILAGLWSVPGIGPKTIIAARKLGLPDRPAGEWVRELPISGKLRAQIRPDLRFAELGERLLQRCERLGICVSFQGDPGFPERLTEIDDPPPLLFHLGPGAAAPPRRRIAMVGTRHPDHAFWRQARDIVLPVVRAGAGVVSGAAMGIDTWCQLSAAKAGGETWAFLGSGIDQVDPSPKRLWRRIEATQATFFSEYPPGVRAEKVTFPRRNRLISGSADAVLVLRAGLGSGTKHTVQYAIEQRRPGLAIPGDRLDLSAAMCNHLLHVKKAAMCMGHMDVLRAIGVSGKPSHRPRSHRSPLVQLKSLSPQAQALISKVPKDLVEIDALMNDPMITSGEVVAALFELELNGFIVRHGGGRVQRV
jgi:DNA processing protein